MHNSNLLAELWNPHKSVFEDRASVDKPVPEGYIQDTARSSYPSNPLTEIDKKFSPQLARVPCRVEPVFGVIENTMKSNTFRGIGFNPSDSYRIQKTSRTFAILGVSGSFCF